MWRPSVVDDSARNVVAFRLRKEEEKERHLVRADATSFSRRMTTTGAKQRDETAPLLTQKKNTADAAPTRRTLGLALTLGVAATAAVWTKQSVFRSGAGGNPRVVTFTVDAGCPPTDYKARHQGFFNSSIVGMRLVTKCDYDLDNEFKTGAASSMTMTRVGQTKTFTGSKVVHNDCEYGFVLENEDGAELFEIGGNNIDPAISGDCDGAIHAGGNVYHNRVMSKTPTATAITTIWGGCGEACPILCKILALSTETGDNVYSVLERDSDEAWVKAEGHFNTIHAGYNDLWASKTDKTIYHSTIDSLDPTNSGWTQQTGYGTLKAIDVGLESVFMAKDSNVNGNWASKNADGSGSWNMIPGVMHSFAVGKRWLWGITWDQQWVWACELPCRSSGIHTQFPESQIRQCEVSLEYAYCTSGTDKVYRADAEISWYKNGVSGARWGWPDNRPASVWTEIPNIAAQMVTVGDEKVWAIDTSGNIKFCVQPCSTGAWVSATGVPDGIVYIDASKYR